MPDAVMVGRVAPRAPQKTREMFQAQELITSARTE